MSNAEITHPLERYKLIADPTISQQCIDNFNRFNLNHEYAYEFDDGSIADAISCGFSWVNTPEGKSYWEGIHAKAKAVTNILPLLPEPIEEPSELNQLRTENEKLRECLNDILESMLIAGTEKESKVKQLLNK
jgi:hypothetical protein